MNEIVKYSDNVTKLTTEIKVIQDNVCQGMIEIGKRLIEIKKELGHGNWLPYVENELGYRISTAKNLIRVSNEFSNRQTFGDLPSSKIFALLDMPQEHREDFMATTNLEDSTVRELKDEIKKYKEENGLLTEKQMKALEEKRRLEEQLQQEKSKPAKVETKVVERVVDNTDYGTINRLKTELDGKNRDMDILVKEKNLLDRKLKLNEQEVKEYGELKKNIEMLKSQQSDIHRRIESATSISGLVVDIENMLQTKLAPVKYSRAISEQADNQIVINNVEEIIDRVEDWCAEMRRLLNKDETIIVEVM